MVNSCNNFVWRKNRNRGYSERYFKANKECCWSYSLFQDSDEWFNQNVAGTELQLSDIKNVTNGGRFYCQMGNIIGTSSVSQAATVTVEGTLVSCFLYCYFITLIYLDTVVPVVLSGIARTDFVLKPDCELCYVEVYSLQLELWIQGLEQMAY